MLDTFFNFYYVDYMLFNEENSKKKLVLLVIDLELTFTYSMIEPSHHGIAPMYAISKVPQTKEDLLDTGL